MRINRNFFAAACRAVFRGDGRAYGLHSRGAAKAAPATHTLFSRHKLGERFASCGGEAEAKRG
ncbi:MAG: hypothetical protein WAJ91_08775, partial [Rhodoplanes sp.]